MRMSVPFTEEQVKVLTSAAQSYGFRDTKEVLYFWIDSYRTRSVVGGKIKRLPTAREVSIARRNYRRIVGKDPDPEILVSQVEDEEFGIVATVDDIRRILKRLDSHARYNQKRIKG